MKKQTVKQTNSENDINSLGQTEIWKKFQDTEANEISFVCITRAQKQSSHLIRKP